MADRIEEPGDLIGSEVYDQVGAKVGTVKQLYGPEGQEQPSWVGVEVSTGIGGQPVLIPLARLKHEEGQVRVPYSKQHLLDAPEVEDDGEVSEEDDARLRDYYAVSRGDQPSEDNPDSYSSQMPDEDGPPQPIESDEHD